MARNKNAVNFRSNNLRSYVYLSALCIKSTWLMYLIPMDMCSHLRSILSTVFVTTADTYSLDSPVLLTYNNLYPSPVNCLLILAHCNSSPSLENYTTCERLLDTLEIEISLVGQPVYILGSWHVPCVRPCVWETGSCMLNIIPLGSITRSTYNG